MQIYRAISNDTSSGITDFSPFVSCSDSSQKNDGRTHFTSIFRRNLLSLTLAAVKVQVMSFPPGFGPQLFKNFFHAENVRNFRTPSQYTNPPVQKRCRHHGQRRIFGTLNPDRALKLSSPFNINTLQAVHSQRASYFLLYAEESLL